MDTLKWILAALWLSALPLAAAYLTNVPQTITQPDGTVIECLASGDEFHNWLHDKDNFTIIKDIQTGWYTYARKEGTGLAPSVFRVGQISPRAAGLRPGLNIDREEYLQKRRDWWGEEPRDPRTPTMGSINNLVVFIRFSDQTEFTAEFSTYNSMFNSTVPNTNSMYNYFLEDSYQSLFINTSFYPPPENHFVVSYQDSLPRSYYMPYSSTNTNGYNNDTERRLREHALLVNAVNYISAFIPPTLDIDADDDGKADNVCFIVKGGTTAWATLLWPHMWSLYSFYVYLNGARVYTYNFQLETSLNSSGVGVLCHEMSHSIGFPDLYHYTSNGISPVGSWDLMQTDLNPPQHHMAYLKSRYGHWLPPVRQITDSGTYWVRKIIFREGNCFRLASNNPQYYYMVEFRKKEGFFESSLPATGMLIYRIDTSEDGDGNADGPPDEIYIYRPNGTLTTNGTISSANYSLETGRTAIHASTNPTPFLGDGLQGGLNITQIGSSSGDSISFCVTAVPPAPTDHDEGFESGDFNSYAWVGDGNADWTIDSANAYEGSYCARSGNIGHNQTSTLSLSVQVPAGGSIAFYKRTSSESGYDFLKFSIDGTQKGQWSGTSAWNYVQYPVAAGTHNLQWTYSKDQGVNTGSDCAWIDNILFRWDAPALHLPPQNLQASSLVSDLGAYLSWQPPGQSAAVLQGYRIFRDSRQITDVDSTQLSYTDYAVLPGSMHTYFLKAFYSSPHGHSIATDTLAVTILGSAVVPELISADVVNGNDVLLHWAVPEMPRGIIGYRIFRNSELAGLIDDPAVFTWTDHELHAGEYRYYMSAVYPAFVTEISASLTVTVAETTDSQEQAIPLPVFGISGCFPNPMHGMVKIKFGLDGKDEYAELAIYNQKGQKVRTLLNAWPKAGYYAIAWDGINDSGATVAPGVYLCRLFSGSKVSVRKFVVMH